MKNIILITYPLLILLNIVFGCIISSYTLFNMGLVTITILVNGILSYAVCASFIQDAYKISLSGIYSFVMLIQIGLAIACNQDLKDNGVFLFYILSFVFQIIIGLIIYNVSKK